MELFWLAWLRRQEEKKDCLSSRRLDTKVFCFFPQILCHDPPRMRVEINDFELWKVME